MTLSLAYLAGLVANLVVGLLCVAAAGVAGVAAFFYIRAKNREVIDPALAASGGDSSSSGLGEMRELKTRIEEMVVQQQDNGETQRAHLARKVDSVRETVESQHHAMTGLRQELRHEVQRRDAELAQIRTHLEAANSGLSLAPISHAALPPASESPLDAEMMSLSFDDEPTPEPASLSFEETAPEAAPFTFEEDAAPEATPFAFEEDSAPEASPFAEVAFDAPAAEVLAPEGARDDTPSPFPSMTFDSAAPEELEAEADEPGLFSSPLAFEASDDDAMPAFDANDTAFSITPFSFEDEPVAETAAEPIAPLAFAEAEPEIAPFEEPAPMPFAEAEVDPTPFAEADYDAPSFAEAETLSFEVTSPAPEATPAPEAAPFAFEEAEAIAPQEEAPALPFIPAYEFETAEVENIADETIAPEALSFEDETATPYEAEMPAGALSFEAAEPASAPAFAEEKTVGAFAEASFDAPSFDSPSDGGPPAFAFEEAVEETPAPDAPTAWISRPEREDAPTETIGGIQIERVGDVPSAAPSAPAPAGTYTPAFSTDEDDVDAVLSASGAVPATPIFDETPAEPLPAEPAPILDEFPSPVVASELAQEASFDFGIDIDAELEALNVEPLAPEAAPMPEPAPEPIQMEVPSPAPEAAEPAPQTASGDWTPATPEAEKVVPPFETPEGAEDLTVVSSIDEETQRALYMAGVLSLDEIARWGRSDARRISAEVGVSEDTIMHQWVFEAQAALFDRFSR